MNTTLDKNEAGRKRLAIGAIIWLSILVALLNLRSLNAPPGWDHALCGRWGCAPPLMTVIGWHGFLLVLIWGPLRLICRGFAPERIRRLGSLMLAVGLVMAITCVIVSAREWNGSVKSVLDFIRASLNAIVSRTDLPSIQLMTLGASARAFATRWSQPYVTRDSAVGGSAVGNSPS